MEKSYLVTNRSASSVVYSIPEDNIRREFMPGETKRINHWELEKLSYQAGGNTLIANYLLVQEPEALTDIGIGTEPEYYMTDKEIIDLINNGSLDAWLDCLDFAPAGVIELLKKYSVELPLNDFQKREALKKTTGFDVDAAIKHNQESKEDDKKDDSTPQRRVKEEAVPAGRRTTPKYKVTQRS